MVIKEKIREKINKLKENRYEIVQKVKDAALVSGTVLSVAALVVTVGMVASAPKALAKQEKALNENMHHEVVEYYDAAGDVDKQNAPDSIIFSGAEFIENGKNGYDVSICGIGTKKDEGSKRHFISLEYSDVNGSEISKMIGKDKEIDFYKALNFVIENYELESCSDIAVESINDLNSAIRNNTEKSFEDHEFGKNFVYSIKNIEFNEQNKSVSFEAKQNARYSKEDKKVMKSGSMTYFKDVTRNKDTNQSYTIEFKVSDVEFEEMKQDPSKILQKFIELSKEKDSPEYNVSVNYIKENTSPFSPIFDMEMEQ